MSEKNTRLNKFSDTDSGKSDGSQRLGNKIDIIKGTKPDEVLDEPSDGAEKYLVVDTLTGENEKYAIDESAPSAKPRDSIMIMDGSKSGRVYSGDNGILGSTMASLRPDGINPTFLYYFLESNFDRINSATKGSAVPHTDKDLVRSLEYEVTSLSEQRKIATVLHTVDQAIQKTEEIVEQATLVRDGLRQTVFSVGINSRGQPRELSDEELQKTRIGEIPSIWDFSRLDEVCSDVVDCLNTTPEYSDDGIRVVLTSEIEDGRYNPDESPYVTEEVYRERIRRIEPRAGDVIFTREAPIGEAFKIPEDERLCLGQRTMQLRVKNGVLDSDYLLEALYSEKMQGWYQRVAVGSTTKHVRVEDVEGMKVPVPEIDEQRKIASLLGSYRSYIEASLHYTDKLRNLKQGLMQDLLSGKARTTDANIEIPEEVAKYG